MTSKARILIVEDEEPLTLLLRYNLDAEGYDVESVARGDEAETRLQEMTPDLIVLDWMLPGLSGIELCRRLRARPETKTLLVYDEPFWRADGFSGQTAGPRSPAQVTIDASPAAGSPGVIASITFGPSARKLDELDPDDRRRAVLDTMAARLGPRAALPAAFVETAWWHEQWTKGCSLAHFPPGILTRFGGLLREPFGRVHWAGTETATVSRGAVDGAVRSGERAAAEILDGL